MSLLSLEKPVTSVQIFQINQPSRYCQPDFSILMSLNNPVQIMEEQLNQSDFILLPPGTAAEIIPDTSCTVGVIRLRASFLLASLDSIELFERTHSSARIIRLIECQPILYAILQHSQECTDFTLSRYYFALVERLNQLFPDNPDDHFSVDTSALPDRGIQILDFIHQQILHPLSLNETAEKIGITPQYLSACFQKHIGCTFKDYTNRQKGRYAAPLLQFSQLSDDTVASLVGFPSVSALDKALQKSHHCSISDFRAKSKLPCREVLPDGAFILSNFHEFRPVPAEADEIFTDEAALSQNAQTTVSFNSNPPVFSHTNTNWKIILNIGQSRYMSNSNLRDQIALFQKEIGFQYGRLLDLFDNTIMRDIGDHSFYFFDHVFKILDFLIDHNLSPFIVLGNRYSKSFNFPVDNTTFSSLENFQGYYRKLEQLLPVFIRSCYNRYGMAEVQKWRFEIVYDTGFDKNRQTIWQFVNNYSKIEKIIHSLCPKCTVGGPGYNSCADLNEYEKLLNTMVAEGVRIDFVSFGIFGLKNLHGQFSLAENGSLISSRSSRYLQASRHFFPGKPIFITEFNNTFDRHNYLNDTVFQACIILWFLLSHGQNVSAIGYVRLSDFGAKSESSSELLFGGSGIYNAIGLRKPAYYSFHFLNALGPISLFHNNGIIAACHNRYSIQILAYHCPLLTTEACNSEHNEQLLITDSYAFDALSPKNTHLILTDMLPGQYLVKTYRINRNSGNLLKEYASLNGVSEISKSDRECFKYLSNPASSITQMRVGSDQCFRFSFMLDSLELLLIQIDFINRGL